MFNPHQKRVLSLDGGGIMGMISLQFLKRMEDQLRDVSGRGADFRLCHFFDLIGGTSTGAIIASGLAIGKSVDELIAFYKVSGRDMFRKASLFRRLYYGYQSRPLEQKLKEIIGTKSVLQMQQDGELKAQLLVVMRNATTDSPWPITTNPQGLYNHIDHPECNLKIPLWKLVRASTAAPTYFKPELIEVGTKKFQFVDGGVTPYNNPALLLYKMATLPEYNLGWDRGEDRLMLVSIGTGLAYAPQAVSDARGRMLIDAARMVPSELIRAIAVENDINCRVIGRCVFGAAIDSELGCLDCRDPHSKDTGGHFLYARYDADISSGGLDAMGLKAIEAGALQIDRVDRIGDFVTIGKTAALAQVDLPRQFASFMPAAPANA